MYLFPGGQLHSGKSQQAVALRRPEKSTAVSCGVVVGERNNIQSGQRTHGGQIGRRVLRSATGREAGVQMQVEGESHHVPSIAADTRPAAS